MTTTAAKKLYDKTGNKRTIVEVVETHYKVTFCFQVTVIV